MLYCLSWSSTLVVVLPVWSTVVSVMHCKNSFLLIGTTNLGISTLVISLPSSSLSPLSLSKSLSKKGRCTMVLLSGIRGRHFCGRACSLRIIFGLWNRRLWLFGVTDKHFFRSVPTEVIFFNKSFTTYFYNIPPPWAFTIFQINDSFWNHHRVSFSHERLQLIPRYIFFARKVLPDTSFRAPPCEVSPDVRG